jgi:hypothetical protein
MARTNGNPGLAYPAVLTGATALVWALALIFKPKTKQ